jgi:hypothetical protein
MTPNRRVTWQAISNDERGRTYCRLGANIGARAHSVIDEELLAQSL